jgi:HAE1 family hydrophobic/amphiphilic exporter-1
MDPIKFSIEKPVTVIVCVILVVLFGIIGLKRMPYQLSPDVVEPEIEVGTTWPGANPYDIEREIIEEQEEVLKGIPGLVEMESSAFNNQASITLRFKIGTDVDDALLRVSNKLNEVREYPENVEKPFINASGSATSPVIWLILRTYPDNPNHVHTYRTFFENEVRQALERVEGVSDLFVAGGVEREMQVTIDPKKLAAYGLGISDVLNVLRSENVNVSAGNLGVGRRDYRIRTVAEFNSAEDIERVVLRSTGQQRVSIGDVGSVSLGYAKRTTAMMHNMKDGMAVGVKPQAGANILELTDRVEEAVRELNDGKLKRENVYFDWVYDQRHYILGAIDLVKDDIIVGGALAVAVLLVFLRSLGSTIIISTAIPISVLGTFIFMYAFGRNLNVVSLAGISFSVGILVDNAIVVLENIDRHRNMGKNAFDSAYDGAKEVWGAILNTTVSTFAVFIPVVFLEAEAGQLFKDIAIAVSFAVILSLFVSVSVIPMLSRKYFHLVGDVQKPKLQVITDVGSRIASFIMVFVNVAIRNRATAIGTVVVFTALSAAITWFLLPQMEYLPQGNRNLIINIMIPPPGLSYEEKQEIGENLFRQAEPHLKEAKDGFPQIENMFYVGTDRIMITGAISKDYERARDLLPLYRRIVNSQPGVFGISTQAGIFQTRLGRGRTIDVDVSGDDMGRVIEVAGMLFGAFKQAMPEAQIRPEPSIETLYPEVRLRPDRDRLKAVGMDSNSFGTAIDVLMDGRRIGDFSSEGQKKVDLVLKASEKEIATPEDLYKEVIAAPGGRLIPVSSLSRLERTTGITQIRHNERRRTVTLQVTPPETIAITEAMGIIEGILGPMNEKGALTGADVRQSGVADKLTDTRSALQWNFILAAFIMYLIMAALFENFIYPFILLFTIPLGAAGGFVGLKLVNVFSSTAQPFDILSMLGFIIAIGIVIDNATLIVYQTLNNVRDYGMGYREAIVDSTRTRLRPIYMSTSTSVLGMLPLVVAPGPGSELYRGLGSVVLGGLVFSTLFTVFVIPALMMFAIRMEPLRQKDPADQGQ